MAILARPDLGNDPCAEYGLSFTVYAAGPGLTGRFSLSASPRPVDAKGTPPRGAWFGFFGVYAPGPGARLPSRDSDRPADAIVNLHDELNLPNLSGPGTLYAAGPGVWLDFGLYSGLLAKLHLGVVR